MSRHDRTPPSADARGGSKSDRNGDLIIAGAIALSALVLFVATLCPTIFVEDSAEFSTAAAVLGLPHPPGYPLHTLLSALFVRAVPIGDIAYRSNLFSAACGAASVALLWVFLRGLRVGRTAALTAAACFAFGVTFWSQCLAAEVHALNCLLLVVTLLAISAAARRPTLRAFAAAGVAVGLLLGHRNLNALYVAGFIVGLEGARRRAGGGAPLRASRLWTSFVGGAAATALVYLYLPITAWRDPSLNMGAPSSLERFFVVVSAQPFYRHFATAPIGVNLGRVVRFVGSLPRELGIAAIAAPIGFVMWRRQGTRCQDTCWMSTATVWMALSCVGFASLYNVLDVDVYFLPACLALSVLAAFGFDAWRGRFSVVLVLLALAAVPIRFASVSLRGVDIAHRYARDLLRAAPPRAVVVSLGDTTTHVLWYQRDVAGSRPDVTVVSFDEISDWYVDQLARRHADLDVPPAEGGAHRWLRTFAVRNGVKRPICLTHPLEVDVPGRQLIPTGLLYCWRPSGDPPEAAQLVALWRDTNSPVSGLEPAEAHVQMIVFYYATSRFALAAALAGIGDFEGSRAQLRALVASDPDRAEQAVAAAMRRIGRGREARFTLGERAKKALALPPADSAAFQSLLSL